MRKGIYRPVFNARCQVVQRNLEASVPSFELLHAVIIHLTT